MIRALHFSTFSSGGGAAIAARRVHDALLSVGVDSAVVTAHKSGSDSKVRQVERVSALGDRLWRQAELRLHAADLDRHRRTRSSHLELFSDDRIAGRSMLAAAMPDADIYNLHWISGLIDNRRFFAAIRPDIPIVWTLHDMNTFTGGCHYAMGCEKYVVACGACPQLGSDDVHDISSKIHARKLQALSRRDGALTRIVTPSKWLAREASRSSILGRFDVRVIPPGLDVQTFAPRNRATSREVFGLPQDRPVILFAADATGTYRKGFDLLTSALGKVKLPTPVVLAALGHGSDLIAGVVGLGRVDNERMLSFAYSAADLFVLPTRADNLPNVLLEAMACGTPSVSFGVGGVPDIVRPGETGFLAAPESVDDLAGAIEDALSDETRLRKMGQRCRDEAVERHSLEAHGHHYKTLYAELLDGGGRARRATNRSAANEAAG